MTSTVFLKLSLDFCFEMSARIHRPTFVHIYVETPTAPVSFSPVVLDRRGGALAHLAVPTIEVEVAHSSLVEEVNPQVVRKRPS